MPGMWDDHGGSKPVSMQELLQKQGQVVPEIYKAHKGAVAGGAQDVPDQLRVLLVPGHGGRRRPVQQCRLRGVLREVQTGDGGL